MWTTAILAAVAMIVQDVLATMMVQAEARNRAAWAGALDSLGWIAGITTTSISVTEIQGGTLAAKVVVIGAVTLANFGGTFAGVHIGKRLIRGGQA